MKRFAVALQELFCDGSHAAGQTLLDPLRVRAVDTLTGQDAAYCLNLNRRMQRAVRERGRMS